VEKFGWQFRARDKVIQTQNDYDKDVFNGDIGQVARIDPEQREVVVRFENRDVPYGFGEMDELALAYRDHDSQVAGLGISGGDHPGGDAAIHAVAAEFDLHGGDARAETGGLDRTEKSAGAGCQERPDGAALLGLLARLKDASI